MMTTQKQVRAAFWELADPTAGGYISKRKLSDGRYTTDTRCAFVDFVDRLRRDGQIPDALAQRVTLGA